MQKILATSIVTMCLFACQSPPDASLDSSLPEEIVLNETVDIKEPSPIELVELAHRKEAFLASESIAFDITLSFGGSVRLKGRMTLACNSSRGLIEYANGDRVIFEGDKVYHNPGIKNPGSVRFAAYTWSYFFLFPYKLSDPGTIWSEKEQVEMNGKTYDYQMLTFEAGTGDAPDDWYKLYVDPEDHLTQVAAYIVTAGATREEAEVDPHAIKYESYVNIAGIPLSDKWTFWAWREEAGLTEQLGEASLSNFEFKEIDADLFEPEEDYLMK